MIVDLRSLCGTTPWWNIEISAGWCLMPDAISKSQLADAWCLAKYRNIWCLMPGRILKSLLADAWFLAEYRNLCWLMPDSWRNIEISAGWCLMPGRILKSLLADAWCLIEYRNVFWLMGYSLVYSEGQEYSFIYILNLACVTAVTDDHSTFYCTVKTTFYFCLTSGVHKQYWFC